MKRTIDITCVVGTRPEAIKMAPLILELKQDPIFQVKVLATGQHTDMLHQALNYFDIVPDQNLQVMKDRQTLDHVTAAVLEGVGAYLDVFPQDILLVHGDTTTTLGAALAGFYRKIPVGHVEAGLRSNNISHPFPEEANRVLVDKISSLYFAPTAQAASNLRKEGISKDSLFVTGNTVIDALFWTLNRVQDSGPLLNIPPDVPLILMTAHRRESWGEPLQRICQAAQSVMEKHPELWLLIPLHKNPIVREVIYRELQGNARVVFSEPLDYHDFVRAMNRSIFIMSDSGGVQEEASALKKPVLILRELSERPEAVTEGTGVLVGTDPVLIEREALHLLEDSQYRDSFADKISPFGNGKASAAIAQIIKEYCFKKARDVEWSA